MKVFFFQRNPGNKLFSIEVLFESIRKYLPSFVEPTVIVSRYLNSGLPKKLYNIFEVLFRPQGDVNHVTGDVHYLTLFLKKRKTILTIHDVNLMYISAPWKKKIHQLVWLKWPIASVRAVTVISQTTKTELLKYVDCDPDKISVIYNCIAPEFKPRPQKFNKEKPMLLHIGTKPNKNLDRLIEALAGLRCKLQIIGTPSEKSIQRMNELGIEYACQSGLTQEQLIEKYVQADMLVFVSTFEGFGLPIVEANTIERPVVTSNVSSMPEIAGSAACLIDPFDVASIRAGIVKVMEDDEYRERLLANGRLNKERFHPQAIADAYSALYKAVYENQLAAKYDSVAVVTASQAG